MDAWSTPTIVMLSGFISLALPSSQSNEIFHRSFFSSHALIVPKVPFSSGAEFKPWIFTRFPTANSSPTAVSAEAEAVPLAGCSRAIRMLSCFMSFCLPSSQSNFTFHREFYSSHAVIVPRVPFSSGVEFKPVISTRVPTLKSSAGRGASSHKAPAGPEVTAVAVTTSTPLDAKLVGSPPLPIAGSPIIFSRLVNFISFDFPSKASIFTFHRLF